MKEKILVVEDDMQILHDIAFFLELKKYRVLKAENGKVALELAKIHIPDLILSDIMMPELDGYGLLDALQLNTATQTIPFLFLSAKSEKQDILYGKKLGADDYITKPFEFNELMEAIEARLRKAQLINQNYSRKLDELRTSISSSLPHELFTPLTLILGYSDFLLKTFDETTDENAKVMLENILTSAQRLRTTLKKYVMYAQLEIIASDDEEIKQLRSFKTVSLQSIITQTASDICKIYHRENDLKVAVEDIPLFISNSHLINIIEELTDNCCKFSKPGSSIEITSSNNKDYYDLKVTDHGRGMTLEQIAGLGAFIQFERRFYEQQGNGLGLSIVKRLSELHLGEFSIDSKPDDYTTVTVRLQIAK